MWENNDGQGDMGNARRAPTVILSVITHRIIGGNFTAKRKCKNK